MVMDPQAARPETAAGAAEGNGLQNQAAAQAVQSTPAAAAAEAAAQGVVRQAVQAWL